MLIYPRNWGWMLLPNGDSFTRESVCWLNNLEIKMADGFLETRVLFVWKCTWNSGYTENFYAVEVTSGIHCCGSICRCRDCAFWLGQPWLISRSTHPSGIPLGLHAFQLSPPLRWSGSRDGQDTLFTSGTYCYHRKTISEQTRGGYFKAVSDFSKRKLLAFSLSLSSILI